MSDMAERGVRETFTAFYEGWLNKHQEFQEKLLECVGQEEECREMVGQVLAHYEEFFKEKWEAANKDAFLVMSPPWISSFERTLLWISAFRPSMLFPVMKHSVWRELSADQVEKIEVIRADTRRQEKLLEEKLAKVQESVAGNDLFGLLRRFERLLDGEISELDASMEKLKMAMLVLIENADALLGSTTRKIMEVLEPFQIVKFVAAFGEYLVRARRWGVHNDSQSSIISVAGSSTSHS